MKKIKLLISVFAVSAVLLMAGLVLAVGVTGELMPNAVGTFNQWKPSTGSTHYTLVDEATCNGATDYVYATTTGFKDSYSLSIASIPNGSGIFQIEITPCASAHLAISGTSTLKVFYRFNGTDSFYGGTYNFGGLNTTPTGLPTATYTYLNLLKLSSTSTLEAGGYVHAGGGIKGIRLGRLSTVVKYIEMPTNLLATATTTSNIWLNWTTNPWYESGFLVERALNGIWGSWTNIATTSPSATSYNNTGVSQNQTYCYKTRAFRVGSGYPDARSAYTTPSCESTATTTPATPHITSCYIEGWPEYHDITWDDNSNNEESFVIERKLDAYPYGVMVTTTWPSETNYHDYAWYSPTSTGFTYRMRAYNSVGFSSYSNECSS